MSLYTKSYLKSTLKSILLNDHSITKYIHIIQPNNINSIYSLIWHFLFKDIWLTYLFLLPYHKNITALLSNEIVRLLKSY